MFESCRAHHKINGLRGSVKTLHNADRSLPNYYSRAADLDYTGLKRIEPRGVPGSAPRRWTCAGVEKTPARAIEIRHGRFDTGIDEGTVMTPIKPEPTGNPRSSSGCDDQVLPRTAFFPGPSRFPGRTRPDTLPQRKA